MCPPCKFTLKVDSCCCQNRDQFVQNVKNTVTTTVDNNLCKVTVNIGNLPTCDEITSLNWGDNTSTAGVFTANSMPMHTYSTSGVYIISYLAVERNAQGQICFELLVKDTIRLSCANECRCGSFSGLYFRPSQGSVNQPKVCGDTLVIPCNPQFNPIVGGTFACLGTCPLPQSTVHWEIRPLSGTPLLASGNVSQANFSISLLPSYFTTPGLYQLTFTSTCGGNDCTPCRFIVRVLPATTVNFNQNLTGYFPFNGNANDVSPTLANGTSVNVTPTTALNGTLSAYSFNGTSSMIDATTNMRGVVDKVSVCAWVKTTETQRGMWVAGQYLGGSTPKGYLLSIGDITNSNGTIGLASFSGRVDVSNYYAAVSNSATKVNDGTWHCLVGTAGDGEWRIYVDGVLRGLQIGLTTPSIAPSNTAFTIGRHSDITNIANGSMWYNGSMDDVRVFSKVLTQCEIDSLCSIRIVSDITDINDRMRIVISPNPNLGTFTVELPEAAKSGMKFRITDLTGRTIQESQIDIGSKQQTVLANALSSGMYLLQVVSETKVLAVEKFVKQ